ncbi:MAG: SufE family protein [Candidatus Shikimatogenerans sp. JK-2022]|nr:SufE family protein [Candidatus Shikimatogenerans bostrichidophilus]
MFYKKILKKIKNKNIYNYLIKIGKKLPYYPNKYKKNKYLLKNCLTNIWLFFFIKKKRILFIGKSESNIINGIIYIIIKLYSNKPPKYIINNNNNIIKKMKLYKILSMNRYLGFLNIIEYIKKYSLNFLKKNKF